MNIQLNGTVRALSPGTTVAQLIADLGLPRDGIAVAVERKVVPRGEHGAHVLEEGAEVEVIRAVGGG